MAGILLGNKTLTTSWQLIFDGPGLATIYCSAAVQIAYGGPESTEETLAPASNEITTWPAGIPLYLPEKRQSRKVYAKVASGSPALQLVS